VRRRIGCRGPECVRFAEEFARFTDRVGDRLPPERRDVHEQLIDSGPRLNKRYHSHRNMITVQGDSHVWNIFLPRAGGSNDVRIFDWDCWSADVGTDDLAYMMALHWYADHRRRNKPLLLDHYHAELLAHGVTGYDRHALDDDYPVRAVADRNASVAGDKQHPRGDLVEQLWRGLFWLSTTSGAAIYSWRQDEGIARNSLPLIPAAVRTAPAGGPLLASRSI
jgi:hypothetical protein